MEKSVTLQRSGACHATDGKRETVGISPPLMPSYVRTTLSGIIKTAISITKDVWRIMERDAQDRI